MNEDLYFHSKLINPKKFDKEQYVRNHITYMIDRVSAMFKYNNLPETIPQRMLEFYLISNGNCFIAKRNDELYAFIGGLGGVPDAYYRPTKYVVANPALKFSKEFEIDKDGILCYNDKTMTGLIPIFSYYGNLLCENWLSMRIALINSRMTSLVTAQTDTGKASVELYLDKLTKGELAVVMDKGLEESIHVNPLRHSNDNTLTSLIEHQQYLKASEFNEIGINANYNMKRESITSSESDLNNESLFPLIDDMLDCRLRFVKEVNDMFGTEIEVDLHSVWKHKKQASELSIISEVNDLINTLEIEDTSQLDSQVTDINEEQNNEEQIENNDSSQTEDVNMEDVKENLENIAEVLTEDILDDITDGGGEDVNKSEDGDVQSKSISEDD